MSNNKPVQVISVTGGKGGVGKTSVSVNLGIALAEAGKEVMLLDADLGLANVDIMLGIRVKKNLAHVMEGECTLNDILIPGPSGLKIVPASSGTQMMTELTRAEHAGLIRAFSDLETSLDYLIIDTAAGIADSVVSFTRAANEIIVVVCDEPTSITDAYALIKVLSRDHGMRKFRVLANMVRTTREGRELFAKLTMVTDRFLDVTLQYLGAIPFDEYVRKAIQKQSAVLQAYPGGESAKALNAIAQKVIKWPPPVQASGHMEFFVERLVQAGA